jgi:replication factor C subunit 3/5
MLYVDKYRPQSLEECDYHQKLSKRLALLATSEDFPHCLMYGPSGAGKKTRIYGLLRAMFGPGVSNVKSTQRSFQIPNKTTTTEVTTVSSNYHIELNPSESGIYDRVVVQEIIKEIAQSQPIETSTGSRSFKVIILNEVDRLSSEAQAGLRRTMEKYMRTCRMILCCTSTTKLIPAILSRCICIRIAAPTSPEIQTVLQSIAQKENFELPKGFAAVLARRSNRNLRRAILMLETCKLEQYPFQEGQRIQSPEWEDFLKGVAELILKEQSPKRLLLVRNKLYELLVHCIPPEIILKKLTSLLLDSVDMQLKYELTKWAAFYEHRLQQGSKPIFHLEAFVAKFMSIYKEHLIQLNVN